MCVLPAAWAVSPPGLVVCGGGAKPDKFASQRGGKVMAIIKGTPGDDTLTGTGGNDKFNLTQGGNDTVYGGLLGMDADRLSALRAAGTI